MRAWKKVNESPRRVRQCSAASRRAWRGERDARQVDPPAHAFCVEEPARSSRMNTQVAKCQRFHRKRSMQRQKQHIRYVARREGNKARVRPHRRRPAGRWWWYAKERRLSVAVAVTGRKCCWSYRVRNAVMQSPGEHAAR